MNVLDYTIVVILVLSAVIGYRKGLTGTIAGVAGLILGLILAVKFCQAFTGFLEQEFQLVTSLGGVLNNKFPLLVPVVNSLLDYSFWNGPGAAGPPLNTLAYWLVVSGCFLILAWVGSKMGRFLFRGLSGLISRGVLGHLNQWGGMVLALVKNVIIIGAGLFIVHPLVAAASQAGVSSARNVWILIANSVICRYLLDIGNFIRAVYL
ncbi:MAG: CvpA family protein [Syntrophomonadaceae bacterium]|jgi:uncharacterized membrane protein required for colicin V production